MGMFDGLLGGGKDDEEEEMRENIDKIREKVQEGQAPAEGAGGERTGKGPVRLDELKEDEGGAPPREEFPARQPPRDSSGEPAPAPERRREGGGSEPESRGPTRDDLPEPPEVRELDVPDIEKGPLFITVDKFRDALRAISDMRRVAADMDDYIGSMEGTLHEDRDTEEGIREILDEAEADTEELKDIVSP